MDHVSSIFLTSGTAVLSSSSEYVAISLIPLKLIGCQDSSFVPELSPSAPGTRKQTPEHDEEGQFRSCDTTTFRFECHKGIKIHLTPVVLQTLTSLAHQLEAKVLSSRVPTSTLADFCFPSPQVLS